MLKKCLPLLMAVAIGACSHSDSNRGSSPLARAEQSPEAVAEAVLRALERKDRAALDERAVSETEFRAHVWSELPAARPERNLPVSYVWGDLNQKSRDTLSGTLASHGGKRYQLLKVSFGGHTKYETFTVHRDTTLRVRDESGAEGDLRVYGSMIEKNGQWKVFSYVVD